MLTHGHCAVVWLVFDMFVIETQVNDDIVEHESTMGGCSSAMSGGVRMSRRRAGTPLSSTSFTMRTIPEWIGQITSFRLDHIIILHANYRHRNLFVTLRYPDNKQTRPSEYCQ
jgi:hypothetical protein